MVRQKPPAPPQNQHGTPQVPLMTHTKACRPKRPNRPTGSPRSQLHDVRLSTVPQEGTATGRDGAQARVRLRPAQFS